MAALTATKVVGLDASAGGKKLKVFTVTPQADGDTVALATWFSSISSAVAFISAGMDEALSYVQAVNSSTTVTLTELEQDGTAATDWTSAEITLWVIGEDEGDSV